MKVLKFVWKVIRIFWAVTFGFGTLGGVIVTLSPSTPTEIKLVGAFGTVIFGLYTFILVKRLRKPAKSTKPTLQVPVTQTPKIVLDVPEETLRHMRQSYSLMQAQQDYQIMKDSFNILQTTTNFETFESRYGLMYRKAFTFIQARQAGCEGMDKFASDGEMLLSQTENLKKQFLTNTYQKEIASAQQLETQSGQNKRLTKFLEQLQERELDFDTVDVYEEIVEKVKALITT